MLAKQVLSQLSYTPTVGTTLILKHFRPFQNPFLCFSRTRVNFLCLQVCLGKSAQETLLGGVYLPDLLQRRLKSGCLATADGEIMQVG